MPILIHDGVITGPYDKVCSAGPCEWCGVPLNARVDWDDTAEDTARHVPYIPAEASSFLSETRRSVQYVVSTRMCGPCMSLHWRIWSDGASEQRGDWTSQEPPDFPRLPG